MAVKILFLFLVLLVFIAAGNWLLRRHTKNYNAMTWSLVELFWYLVSFVAVCIGLVEIDRIERFNNFRKEEKVLLTEFENSKSIIYAQTRLLALKKKTLKKERDGCNWFLRMNSLMEEGIESRRWESFLLFTRSFVFKEQGCHADLAANMQEFNWPSEAKIIPENIYLREEIASVVENLKTLQRRKRQVAALRPEDNTNYLARYILIFLYLLGLSLKILKIRADYKKSMKGVKAEIT